jgi:hypothetical protein
LIGKEKRALDREKSPQETKHILISKVKLTDSPIE